MSIQAVGWVLDHSQSRGFSRLVLIALANHANSETNECWPSQRTIATEAGISPGAVPAQVRALVDLGEIEMVEPGGPRRSARYRLTFQRSGDEHKSAQEMSAARGPGVSAALSPGVSRTVIDRQEEDLFGQAKPEPYSSEFEQWWSGYPRKDDKRGAFNAYKARRRAGISAERLTEARDRYIAAKDDGYLKYGKTFLEHNDGPWSEWEHHEAPSLEALVEPKAGPSFVADFDQSRPSFSPDGCPLDLCDGRGYVYDEDGAHPCPHREQVTA